MSQSQHSFLDQVNAEIRRLSTLIDPELSGRIDEKLAETLNDELREKSAVNVLAVLAIQLVADQTKDEDVFNDSVIYGGLLSQLLTHYYHQMKANQAFDNTHEAPNATQ
jgi:hypothetical protein